MARNVNTTIVPLITLHTLVYKQNGSVDEKVMNIEDMVTDLRYAGNGKNNKISGRVADIGFSVAKTKRLYTSVAKAKSWFKYDVTPTTLTIDSSTENHSVLTEIPIREIIEDEGVEEVKRIDSYLSYGFHCEVLRSDETTNIFDVKEGDILSDIRYLYRGDEAVLPAAKLIAIKRDGTTMKPTTLVLNLENKLRQIPIEQLVNIGGAGQPIGEADSIMDNITSDSPDKQNVYVGPGTFTEALTISGNVAINGNKVGIWGTSKNRNKETFEDETILSKAIKVEKGSTVEIDGCVLTKESIVTVASGCEEITIRNCIISGLEVKNTRAAFITGPAGTESTKLVVENCYFAKNPETATSKFYNLLELQFPIKNGTSICGNYFEKGVGTHNVINIYDVVDADAVINLNDNTFEYAGAAVRIGTKGDAHCTININNINYYEQDPDEGWEGFMLIQGYTNLTKDMSHVRVNINKVQRNGLTGALYLQFTQYKEGFFFLTEETAPYVYVDGTLYPRMYNHIEYQKDEYLKQQEEKKKKEEEAAEAEKNQQDSPDPDNSQNSDPATDSQPQEGEQTKEDQQDSPAESPVQGEDGEQTNGDSAE